MAEDLFAGLKSLTAQQREALRRALVERALVAPTDTATDTLAEFVVSPEDMTRITAAIPGGLDNVEGVYPLTPLQEGMLFHHLLAREDDPYVLHQGMRFASREALERFVAALHAVLARHGILRSAMMWDELRAPVQVVCRDVGLPLFELDAEQEGVEPQAVAAWLVAQSRLPRYRIDVARAPLMRLLCAPDRSGGWLLLVASHHLIGDRTSLGLMRSELQAHLSGMPDLQPRARQFGEYALAVHARGREADAVFFRELLGDVDEPTAPFGLLDPIDASAPLAEARRSLDGAFARRLREQAGRAGVGLPAVVHAACSLVLARASGREDVVFGTVLSGRMRDASMGADMLGMLVNTLPYRAKLSGRSTLDCVLDAQRMLARLIAHEYAPLALARGASKIAPPTPLFGALLDYRRVEPAPEGGMPGSAVFAAPTERTSFPLTFTIDEAGDVLACTVQTFEKVGPARVVEYFVEALRQLTDALEHAPWLAATAIDVAPAEASNPRACEAPSEWCVHELFEGQAARTPHAPCLISDASSIAYATLDARANRLARHLRRLGVESETRVALCFERSVEAIVAMLAVLKAGGAYVPLDPASPHARIQLLIRISRPALILVGDGVRRDAFAQAGAPVLEFRETQSCPCCAEHDEPQEAVAGLRQTPTQTAYVLFTSGSTGEPKGVAVEHRSVSAFARAHARWCGLGDGDRVLQFASHSFDNSVAEIFPALSVGAAVVLRPDGPTAPDRSFVDYLARHAVTVADLPTAFWHAWARRLGEGDTACAPRPPLRLVLAGGEKAQHEAVRQWLASPSTAPIRMADTYGITEATVNSIVGELTRAHAGAPDALALGRPLGDTRAYVVDTQGRLAPVGVTGEICIGGPGVARGYFDRPALTAARFVPDPFGAPGTRLYRTGDLGRTTASGEIVYVGRADAQVKILGYRIEPAEVETALRTIPGVRDAKVLARDDRLIAYLVADDAAKVREGVLRASLATQLPRFMIPAAFVAVPALPVNTNGKIDVEGLRATPRNGTAFGEGAGCRGFPPKAPTEIVVADIWRALLERDRLDLGDDFFDLGGHSLLAIRVVSRVKAAIGAEVGVRDLFTHPTLGAFTRAVERAPRVERESAAVAPVSYPARLSFGQERLWFLSRLDARHSAAYHLVGGLRLVGDVDVRVLKAALERIVERHEILRTVFEEQDGVPHAVPVPVARAYAWEDADLSADSDTHARVAELFARTAREPFDLAQGPLLRVTFATIAPRDHALVAAMHHIVADGWSMSVLTSELSTLYARFSAGETAPYPPLPFQYAAHARWQRDRIEARGEGLQFWRSHLANAPALLTLPTDRPRPAVQNRLGASVDFVLDAPLTEALTALAARHGATLHMTLLAGYAALLSRLAGQTSVVVGTPVANRPSLELERLIGFFANTLALHIDLSGAPTVAQLLAQVKRTTLAAYEHQDVPFEQVVDAVNPRRERAYDPLVQTTLVWQNTPSGRVELDGVAVYEIHPEVTTAQCDLSLLMEERSGAIAGTVVYATALFERATIERYLRAWRELLFAMTTDDSARLGVCRTLHTSGR